MTNAGATGTVFTFIRNGTTPGLFTHTLPLLSLADSAGGPTSARSMKGAITITNRTQYLNMGGQVAVLNSPQRVSLPAAPSAMTRAQWSAFMDSLVSHPRSRIYNGADFKTSKTFICHPLDQTDYISYDGFGGTATTDEFWSHFAIWPGLNPYKRPMSTVFAVFEPVSVANAYEFKTRASFYTRWPLDSVPGQAQRPVPTASPAIINRHRDHAEATGHIPRSEEVGVAAAAAAAGGGAAWLVRAMQAAQAAAGPVMEGLELAAPLLAL